MSGNHSIDNQLKSVNAMPEHYVWAKYFSTLYSFSPDPAKPLSDAISSIMNSSTFEKFDEKAIKTSLSKAKTPKDISHSLADLFQISSPLPSNLISLLESSFSEGSPLVSSPFFSIISMRFLIHASIHIESELRHIFSNQPLEKMALNSFPIIAKVAAQRFPDPDFITIFSIIIEIIKGHASEIMKLPEAHEVVQLSVSLCPICIDCLRNRLQTPSFDYLSSIFQKTFIQNCAKESLFFDIISKFLSYCFDSYDSLSQIEQEMIARTSSVFLSAGSANPTLGLLCAKILIVKYPNIIGTDVDSVFSYLSKLSQNTPQKASQAAVQPFIQLSENAEPSEYIRQIVFSESPSDSDLLRQFGPNFSDVVLGLILATEKSPSIAIRVISNIVKSLGKADLKSFLPITLPILFHFDQIKVSEYLKGLWKILLSPFCSEKKEYLFNRYLLAFFNKQLSESPLCRDEFFDSLKSVFPVAAEEFIPLLAYSSLRAKLGDYILKTPFSDTLYSMVLPSDAAVPEKSTISKSIFQFLIVLSSVYFETAFSQENFIKFLSGAAKDGEYFQYIISLIERILKEPKAPFSQIFKLYCSNLPLFSQSFVSHISIFTEKSVSASLLSKSLTSFQMTKNEFLRAILISTSFTRSFPALKSEFFNPEMTKYFSTSIKLFGFDREMMDSLFSFAVEESSQFYTKKPIKNGLAIRLLMVGSKSTQFESEVIKGLTQLCNQSVDNCWKFIEGDCFRLCIENLSPDVLDLLCCVTYKLPSTEGIGTFFASLDHNITQTQAQYVAFLSDMAQYSPEDIPNSYIHFSEQKSGIFGPAIPTSDFSGEFTFSMRFRQSSVSGDMAGLMALYGDDHSSMTIFLRNCLLCLTMQSPTGFRQFCFHTLYEPEKWQHILMHFGQTEIALFEGDGSEKTASSFVDREPLEFPNVTRIRIGSSGLDVGEVAFYYGNQTEAIIKSKQIEEKGNICVYKIGEAKAGAVPISSPYAPKADFFGTPIYSTFSIFSAFNNPAICELFCKSVRFSGSNGGLETVITLIETIFAKSEGSQKAFCGKVAVLGDSIADLKPDSFSDVALEKFEKLQSLVIFEGLRNELICNIWLNSNIWKKIDGDKRDKLFAIVGQQLIADYKGAAELNNCIRNLLDSIRQFSNTTKLDVFNNLFSSLIEIMKKEGTPAMNAEFLSNITPQLPYPYNLTALQYCRDSMEKDISLFDGVKAPIVKPFIDNFDCGNDEVQSLCLECCRIAMRRNDGEDAISNAVIDAVHGEKISASHDVSLEVLDLAFGLNDANCSYKSILEDGVEMTFPLCHPGLLILFCSLTKNSGKEAIEYRQIVANIESDFSAAERLLRVPYWPIWILPIVEATFSSANEISENFVNFMFDSVGISLLKGDASQLVQCTHSIDVLSTLIQSELSGLKQSFFQKVLEAEFKRIEVIIPSIISSLLIRTTFNSEGLKTGERKTISLESLKAAMIDPSQLRVSKFPFTEKDGFDINLSIRLCHILNSLLLKDPSKEVRVGSFSVQLIQIYSYILSASAVTAPGKSIDEVKGLSSLLSSRRESFNKDAVLSIGASLKEMINYLSGCGSSDAKQIIDIAQPILSGLTCGSASFVDILEEKKVDFYNFLL